MLQVLRFVFEHLFLFFFHFFNVFFSPSVVTKMSLLFLMILLGIQLPMAVVGLIDCRKVVYHPSCQGISAKRTNFQNSDIDIAFPTISSSTQPPSLLVNKLRSRYATTPTTSPSSISSSDSNRKNTAWSEESRKFRTSHYSRLSRVKRFLK